MSELEAMMAKAEDCLESAEHSLKGGYYDAAANRAYYGVFDALSALLLNVGLLTKSHNGERTLFSEHFIKPGIFPKEAGIWVHYCFEIRQQSDYDFSSKLETEEVERSITYCRDFIRLVRNHLKTR